MLEIGGKIFTLDLDGIENIVIIDKNYEGKFDIVETITDNVDTFGNSTNALRKVVKQERQKQVDQTKYETIRLLIELILTDTENLDDSLGFDRAMSKSSLGFKITFNTLLEYGILKEIN